MKHPRSLGIRHQNPQRLSMHRKTPSKRSNQLETGTGKRGTGNVNLVELVTGANENRRDTHRASGKGGNSFLNALGFLIIVATSSKFNPTWGHGTDVCT